MKRITTFFLSLFIVAALSIAEPGIPAGNQNAAQNSTEELHDTVSSTLNGAGGWLDFAEGFACGVGIVASVVTFPTIATGAGALAWVVLASGTAAACAAA
jgi:hypothetical protein